jgi:hypothetical protein
LNMASQLGNHLGSDKRDFRKDRLICSRNLTLASLIKKAIFTLL